MKVYIYSVMNVCQSGVTQDRFGDSLKSVWRQFGVSLVSLVSVRGQFGVRLDQLAINLGSISDQFGIYFIFGIIIFYWSYSGAKHRGTLVCPLTCLS